MKTLSAGSVEKEFEGFFGRAGSVAATILTLLTVLQIARITKTMPSYKLVSSTQHLKSLLNNVTSVVPGNTNTSLQNSTNLTSHSASSRVNSSLIPNDIQPTILQQLGGELGNHLGYLMHGFAVKWYAQDTLGLDFQLISLHQSHSKWVRGRNDMIQCFPKFRGWNFERDQSWAQYQERREQQAEWLSKERQDTLSHANDEPEEMEFNASMIAYLDEYKRQDKPTTELDTNEISMPFLATTSMVPKFFIDRYFDRIRDLLVFNTSNNCCDILPEEDETVFHFRNFGTELPRGVAGLVDFGPNQTARDLFGHLEPGDKVAIITRFKNAKSDAQVNALTARGLQVRLITGQSGVQDFCILLHAKKEVIGSALSTFAFWGSMLGTARKARLSVPVSSKLLERHHGSMESIRKTHLYNYTNPRIKEKLEVSLFPLEQ
eukprot:Nitzschia sp. Nitz4//scaffold12_size214221//73913//75211//NITZ4_001494-RA/size214221-processed-gene-0.154-mRNA-1//-1//CDS//3329535002//845//frame0